LKCPENCSEQGTCDNTIGKCDCFDGYRGSDCSIKIRKQEDEITAAPKNDTSEEAQKAKENDDAWDALIIDYNKSTKADKNGLETLSELNTNSTTEPDDLRSTESDNNESTSDDKESTGKHKESTLDDKESTVDKKESKRDSKDSTNDSKESTRDNKDSTNDSKGSTSDNKDSTSNNKDSKNDNKESKRSAPSSQDVPASKHSTDSESARSELKNLDVT
jgi:hypothetical protein